MQCQLAEIVNNRKDHLSSLYFLFKQMTDACPLNSDIEFGVFLLMTHNYVLARSEFGHPTIRLTIKISLCPLPSALCFCPLPSALCPLPSALCPLPSALCPLPSVLCPLPSALCPLPSALCPLPSALCPPPSALCPLPSALFFISCSHNKTGHGCSVQAKRRL